MKQTTNYNLIKPELTDSPPDITVMNPNWDKIDEKLKEFEEENDNLAEDVDELFQSVSDGKTLVAGAITDKGVNTSPTDTFQTMADNIEAIETDPSIGTTDATAADILSGKKAVSEGELRTGTMPNRGPVSANVVNLTEQNEEYTIAQGYHSGLRKIKAAIEGLVANVIKAGTTVGGILGTFTSDATATAARMLSGYTAYVNGNKITGLIPSKGAQMYTPGTTNQTIAANQYLNDIQTIAGSANLVPTNIKEGVNIFGKVGTLKEALSTSPSDITIKPGNQGSQIDVDSTEWSSSTQGDVYITNSLFFLVKGNENQIRIISPTSIPMAVYNSVYSRLSFTNRNNYLATIPTNGGAVAIVNSQRLPIEVHFETKNGASISVYPFIK